MCHIRLKKVRKSYFYKLLFLTFAEKKVKTEQKTKKNFSLPHQKKYYFFLLLLGSPKIVITFSYFYRPSSEKVLLFLTFAERKKFLQKITEKVKTLPSSD